MDSPILFDRRTLKRFSANWPRKSWGVASLQKIVSKVFCQTGMFAMQANYIIPLHFPYLIQFVKNLTNRKWLSVVYTLIDNDIRHHSGKKMLTIVMTNIIVDKSTDNVEPLSICFLPQYSMPKKVFISQRDQNHDTKKEQASITFSQCDWFISQNGRS